VRMEKLSDWDNATPEERRDFLKGTLAEEKMNLELIVQKEWKDLSFFESWSLQIYLTGL